MKSILKFSLVFVTILSSISLCAQGRGGEGKHNMFGFKAAATIFDIKTNNFNTVAESGFIGGLATRGDFYDNWDIQFGINISNNKLKVEAREIPIVTSIEEIEYSLLNAQIHLLFGYKIFWGNKRLDNKFKLTAELGPVLMINSKMKMANEDKENYIIGIAPRGWYRTWRKQQISKMFLDGHLKNVEFSRHVKGQEKARQKRDEAYFPEYLHGPSGVT